VRLLAVAVNNASWLISNDVAGKDDVEKALMLGMGLKEGIFGLAERTGYARIVDTLKGLRDSSRNDFYEPDALLLNLVKG
jgi:enoyl-CoA hydratase/3-hydroxyacyl-CoA dehydrogenase